MALFSKACFVFKHPPIRNFFLNIIDTNISYLTFLRTPPHRRIAKIQSIAFPSLRNTGQTNKNAPDESKYYKASELTLQENSCIKSIDSFRDKLKEVGEATSFESLLMIDAVQRLDIGHHFPDEIEELLRKHYIILNKGGSQGMNLREVALRFRLLRQQGYYVPAGIFKEFKDQEGKFHFKLCSDIQGLSELYEASQLSIKGEDILDDAEEFSAKYLTAWLKQLNHSHASRVQNTLNYPHHKSVSKFMAINLFHQDLQDSTNKWIYILQEVAKTDFKMLQPIYQQEILQISEWWKELGLAKEIAFVRDQPLIWYSGSMACLTEPSLSDERIELTKSISMIFTIDDIFDNSGKIDELTVFTEAVKKWDYADVNQLPDYMKLCFKALYEITNGISYKVYKKHGSNPIKSLINMWVSLCEAFLVEAKWFASGKLPNSDDYLKNGIISSGVHVTLGHIYFLLGEGISKEKVELLNNNPGIIKSTATILRLWDDLGGDEEENQGGFDGSFLNCYMNKHQSITTNEAKQHVSRLVSKAWKELNQECLSTNPLPSSFKKAALNMARMVPMLYGKDENHSITITEEYMKAILRNSAKKRQNHGTMSNA